jgi:flagellar basal body-associated protein FliL
MENIVINPRGEIDGANRHLELSLTFEVADTAAWFRLFRRSASLTDTLITLYSARTAKELSDPKTRGELKDRMLTIARSFGGKGILRAAYTQYVLK